MDASFGLASLNSTRPRGAATRFSCYDFPCSMDLTSAYTFDAAHRIAGHPGKCAWLHGHTYQLEVTISSPTLNPLGMVMDFDDLRHVVRKAILDLWDHATLLAANDPLGTAISAVQYEAPVWLLMLRRPP